MWPLIRFSRAQQHVVWLVAPQHVVDEVGGKRHLPPGFLFARHAPLDQARDHRALSEAALQ
jgi:hypothetical protein